VFLKTPISHCFPFALFFVLFFALTPSGVCLAPVVQAEPLTVFEGLETVTSRSYEVRIAREYLEAARQTEQEARSRRLPQITAYADQTWLENRPEAIFSGGSSPLGEDEFLRYGVNLRQSITDFGRTRAGITSAGALSRVEEGRLSAARNASALAFLQGYIHLLQAEKTLEVTAQEVRRFEAHLSNARALYDAGEVTRSDILSAEVNLAEAALKNLTAGDDLELAASRVNFLVLRPLDQLLEVFDFPSPFVGIPELEDLTRMAQANRPELQVLDDKVAAREAQVSLQKSDHYPRLFAGGGYSYEENPFRVHEDNWSLMLGITWDLYSGGAVSAGEKRALRELDAATTEREKVKTSIFLEIREELQRLKGSINRTQVTGQALRQAEENLRLQKAKYQEGEASATDVTDAVTALSRAGNNHWAAVYDTLRAQAGILFCAGTDLADAYNRINLEKDNEDSTNATAGEER